MALTTARKLPASSRIPQLTFSPLQAAHSKDLQRELRYARNEGAGLRLATAAPDRPTSIAHLAAGAHGLTIPKGDLIHLEKFTEGRCCFNPLHEGGDISPQFPSCTSQSPRWVEPVRHTSTRVENGKHEQLQTCPNYRYHRPGRQLPGGAATG